jgi:hopanoid biosynthesis associated protein HpnK
MAATAALDPGRMKKLIITGDDFGLCSEVNEAILQAHTQGILTCASLMVGEPAAGEAVALARRTPSLKVGLHLTLIEGTAVLPPSSIPDLVDDGGRFSRHIMLSGVRYFFSRELKRQIALESEAQIRRFLDSGLALDHLNSHNHLHIHPTILSILLPLAAKYQIKAMRVPWQDWRNWLPGATLTVAAMVPWVAATRRKLRRAHIAFTDEVFGLCESGAMVEETWARIIPKIKDGVTEVYCHPATQTTGLLKETMPSYRHAEELKALISPALPQRLDEYGIQRVSFGELARAGGEPTDL